MGLIRIPPVGQLEIAFGNQLVTMERVETRAIFRNRRGEVLADITVENPPTASSPALIRLGAFDTDYRDVLIKEWHRPGAPNEKLPAPATALQGLIYAVDWSPESTYVAFGMGTVPNFGWYKRDGDTFTKMPSPAYVPTTGVSKVKWSPDGQHLVVVNGPDYPNGTPAPETLIIYKRSGDTLTRVANPTLQAGAVVAAEWSPDGNYLVLGHSSSPDISVYSRTGDTFAKVVIPTNSLSGNVVAFAFSPDGSLLLAAHNGHPYVTLFTFNNGVAHLYGSLQHTPIAAPKNIVWSPDGNYVAMSHINGSYNMIYKWNGSTLNRLTNLSGMTATVDVDWSPDGKYVAFSLTAEPRLAVFKRNGDAFTRIPDPATLASGSGYNLKWSPDGKHLVLGQGFSPYFAVFKSAMSPLSGPATKLEFDT